MGCGSVSKLNEEQQEVMDGVRSKYGLSRRTAAAIANRFIAADEDASESLDYKEFLAMLDMEDSRLAKNLFNTLDKKQNLEEKDGFQGKDAQISFKEFAEEMGMVDAMNDQERWKWTFQVYDKNKNGFLDLGEIMQAMNDPNVGIKFSNDRLKMIFHSRACRNVNKITQAEFVLQVKKHEILEMPVKLLMSKIRAYVFDYESGDDDFDENASHKVKREYGEAKQAAFQAEAEKKKEMESAPKGRGGGKKGGKISQTKVDKHGNKYEDSD